MPPFCCFPFPWVSSVPASDFENKQTEQNGRGSNSSNRNVEKLRPSFKKRLNTQASYAIFKWQKISRELVTDSQLKRKLKSAGIMVAREGYTPRENEVVISEKEFRELRQSFKSTNEDVKPPDCKAVTPDHRIKPIGRLINPSTIITLKDGETLDANHIANIDHPEGVNIKLVASAMVDHTKPLQATAFAKAWIEEGEKERQLIIVNLTEKKEGSLYMPLNDGSLDDTVVFGTYKKTSLNCFGSNDIDLEPDTDFDLEADPSIPHSLRRLTEVKTDLDSKTTYCGMEIINKQKSKVSKQYITAVSSEFKDHQAMEYQRFENFIDFLIKLALENKNSGAEEKTIWIHCHGGCGRTSQILLGLMAMPRLREIALRIKSGEIDVKEAALALLGELVKEIYGARRPGAVNEPGFFLAYCFIRQRLMEEIRAKPHTLLKLSSASTSSRHNVVLTTEQQRGRQEKTDSKKNLNEIRLSAFAETFGDYLEDLFNPQEGDEDAMSIEVEKDERTKSQSILRGPEEQKVEPSDAGHTTSSESKNRLAKLAKRLRSHKNKTFPTVPTEPHSLNARESQESQPSIPLRAGNVANLRERYNHDPMTPPAPPSVGWNV